MKFLLNSVVLVVCWGLAVQCSASDSLLDVSGQLIEINKTLKRVATALEGQNSVTSYDTNVKLLGSLLSRQQVLEERLSVFWSEHKELKLGYLRSKARFKVLEEIDAETEEDYQQGFSLAEDQMRDVEHRITDVESELQKILRQRAQVEDWLQIGG